MKKYSLVLLLSAMSLVSFIPSVSTQTEEVTESEDVAELSAMTCRDLLKSNGDRRTNSLIFMHGYISGKKGETLIDAPALANVTDRAIDTCIDNPDKSVLSVLEEVRQ